MKVLKLGLFFIFITSFQVAAAEERRLTTEQWLEDLDFVISKLKSHHPNLYHKINNTKFDSIVGETRTEMVQSKSDIECYFSIRKMIAAIEDGHTQLLENGIFNLLDLRFPFRVDEFIDGVYITLISKEQEMFLGSRVISINGKPMESILAMTEKIVNCDNGFGRRYWALNGISFARILAGLKVIDNTDQMDLELISRNHEPMKLTLRSIFDNIHIEYGWSSPLHIGPTKGEYMNPSDRLGKTTPLYLKNQGDRYKFYWFEHLVKERTIYFQFNKVADQPNIDETFTQFSTRMWDYIDQNAEKINKLIIDLRYNDGGNGLMILPFLNQIIRRDYIDKEGSLYVISGKKTYSAASMFMYELAVHTNAFFVGEPDACGTDLFSDSNPVGNLPHSGFPLWISSLQFTRRFPVNNSEYIMPDFPAPFSSHEYFTGIDPAMDLIFNGDLRSVAEFAADEGAEKAFIYYQQLKEKYKDLNWWNALDPEILEGSIHRKGHTLMQNGNLESAFQVFTLNTMLFPNSFEVWDSLGECNYTMDKYILSLQCYEKSIELNPENKNGKEFIDRIQRERIKK